MTGNTAYGVPGGTSSNDDQYYGIYVNGADAVVTDNAAYNSGSTGINVSSARAVVTGNTAYGNAGSGMDVDGSSSAGAAATVSGNTVYGNRSYGISASYATVTGNTVHGQTGGSYAGLSISSGSTASGNAVYGNAGDGIYVQSSGVAAGNRVFNNAGDGIEVYNGGRAEGNRVYSNAVGIRVGSSGGAVSNNLVYANANQGVLVTSTSGSVVRLTNNTVYQPVGDAVRVQSSNVRLSNNVLWVNAGYAISVDADSQQGFASDYNLLHTTGSASSNAGFWGGTARKSLADWQAATAQDGHSVAGDPRFVDIDGADNVVGYRSSGTAYDGGGDDNFHLAAGSAAIDSGHSWSGPVADLSGTARRDDAATTDTGSIDYKQATLASSLFTAGGTAKNWRSNNTYWNLTLPFAFPFYDSSYTSVSISSEGFLHFAGPDSAGDGANSAAKLAKNRRIAPLWAALRTDQVGNDIFLDQSVAGQVTIRWNATSEGSSGGAANFAVTLFSSGKIRFDYGSITTTGMQPTVGISYGGGRSHILASGSSDGSSFSGAASIEFAATDPGVVDIGAYEFRGSSADTTAPTVIATTPAAVGAADTVTSAVTAIDLTFSEPVNPIDAAAVRAYELVGSGPDGSLGTTDDVVYTLLPAHVDGSKDVTLNIDEGQLPSGAYRLTVFSNASSGVHDTAGVKLDGDGNGTAGGDYVRVFTVGAIAQPWISVSSEGTYTLSGAPGSECSPFTRGSSRCSRTRQRLATRGCAWWWRAARRPSSLPGRRWES